MRAGINIIPEGPIDEMVALAVTAERLGYDRCWVYDEGLITRDVWVVLSALATATERLHLGPGITNPYTRHPAQTASATASLHELSGGRAFLGIGAGGSLTLNPIGLSRPKPLTAVRETIDIARALFEQVSVDYVGSMFELRAATMGYASPDIEIWLAGRGPKMVALGAGEADGVMLDFIYRDNLDRAFGQITAAADAAGRVARVSYSTAVVTGDDDLAFVRPHMTYRLVDAPADVRATLGIDDAAVHRIRSAMADGLDAAAEHVRDEWVLPFVISGSSSECAATIGGLRERYGLDEFLLPMFPMPDQHRYLERIAPIVDAAR